MSAPQKDDPNRSILPGGFAWDLVLVLIGFMLGMVIMFGLAVRLGW